MNLVSQICPSCSAPVVVDSQTKTAICAYCQSTVVPDPETQSRGRTTVVVERAAAELEEVLDTMQTRIDNNRDKMKLRRCTVEHVFGTMKSWMGSGHFTMKGLAHVGTEISLHVLAYNMRRVMAILGIAEMLKALRLARA